MNRIFDKVIEQKSKSYFVVLFVVVSLLLNYLGRYTSNTLQLPIWFDSVGTCLVAYVYGPFAGAIVGGCLPLSYGIFDPVSCFYILSGAMIGFTCGMMARYRYFDTFFKMNHVVVIITCLSVLIASPVNIIFREGYVNNIWGDGVYEMLREMDVNPIVSSVIGEFIVDFLDRYVTLLLVYVLIYMRRRWKQNKNCSVVVSVFLVLLLVSVPAVSSQAREIPVDKLDQGFYTCTVYNDRNGLPGGEANDISSTHDGYVWVGTYSGLYQYDGVEFVIKHSDVIKNVNCLYCDDEGRMWVGTNDHGLVVLVGNEIANIVDATSGLTANSVSCIGCDSTGFYYIGTKDKLSVIKIVGGMEVVNTLSEIEYARSVSSDEEGLTVVINNLGEAFVLKEGEIQYSFRNPTEGEGFSCVEFCNGVFMLGTYGNQIFKYQVGDTNAILREQIDTKELRNIQSIMQEEDGKVWIGTSSGIGYWKDNSEVHVLKTGVFSTAISNSSVDYQGNLWFGSTRLGLLKVSESVFANIYSECNLQSDVVNAVTMWNGKIYIGSDDGLDVMSTDYEMEEHNVFSEKLEGQRIRNLYVDSKNHLWIAVSAGDGLWELDAKGHITRYTEAEGMLSNRIRSVTELMDGTIAVAEDTGIDFIKNGRKVGQLTVDDGFSNSMILTICETTNGDVYVGTDGGGVYLLQNKKIVKNISMVDGLSSDVVLRILEDEDGLLVVASNGLNYIGVDGTVRYLDQFPYSNNFDIHIDEKSNAWISSSNGMYIVKKQDLISNQFSNCKLLDSKYGLNGAITSNAWGLATEQGELYIPCDDGCYVVNKKRYQVGSVPYRMGVDYTMADNVKAEMSASRVITVPGDARDVSIHVLVPNYTENEIYVGYRLEGYEYQETKISAKELSEIKYTRLPSGNYKLTLNLYDESNNVLESVYYTIEKQMRIFDYQWFKLYFVGVFGMFLIWSTWMIIKSRSNRILQKQREKMELLEHQARVSNETIMAIAKTVDAKDPRTSKHSERVAQYSVCIARALGWSEQECEDLYKTGLLHDIGKIGIPDNVLNKPDRLTDDEYAIMKTHVDKGAEILRGFTIVKDVDLGTRFHHERYDGKGYPKGLAGEEIPIQARIIGIADAFDAMTSNRVYRKKLDLQKVLEEMRRCAGSQFDPDLTEVFLKLIDDGLIDVEVLYENE